jgi:hypothetical protein
VFIPPRTCREQARNSWRRRAKLARFVVIGVIAMLAPVAALRNAPAASWNDSRCTSCHEIDPLFSHPVGVVPSMLVPTHLPLEDGRITCVTCHDYDHFRKAATGPDEGSALLRSPGRQGPAFCSQCHFGKEPDRKTMHATAAGRAHLLRPDRRVERARDADSKTPSRKCLSCHDGTIASDATSRSAWARFGAGGHPVDVVYQGRTARARRNLRPVAFVDARIRLANGRVGCEACHSLYSQRKGLLVMSNRGSRLCGSCHRL